MIEVEVPKRGQVRIYDDPDQVAHAAAAELARIVEGVLADRARACIALAGGSTPRAMYRLLARPGYRDRIEWPRVEIFFGDERCVPPDHRESNYRMAREELLDHVPLAADHVHRILGEREPHEAARLYREVLGRVFFGEHGSDDGPPRFDLILLGVGPDGHTASLFPGTQALQEKEAWVVANFVEKLDTWRLTLTAPVLSAASHVMITATGQEKADALALALAGPDGSVPIQQVQAAEVRWFVDRAAAQKWQRSR
jgi:6-phosphogluconolactonase